MELFGNYLLLAYWCTAVYVCLCYHIRRLLHFFERQIMSQTVGPNKSSGKLRTGRSSIPLPFPFSPAFYLFPGGPLPVGAIWRRFVGSNIRCTITPADRSELHS